MTNMSFMDKVKAGMAEAGHKAKTVVEINRLKLQNHNKLGEIDQQYKEIGKRVYVASLEDSGIDRVEGQLYPFYSKIKFLQEEIQHNLQQIKFLSEEQG